MNMSCGPRVSRLDNTAHARRFWLRPASLMLGIGLMLVCLRVLIPGVEWKEGLLRFSFWSLNGGLMAMCVLSLLPVGLMQTWASVEHGYWYARSSEFMQTPLMQNLRWMRIPGDTIFFLGAVALVLFVAGLKTGHSFRKKVTSVTPAA